MRRQRQCRDLTPQALQIASALSLPIAVGVAPACPSGSRSPSAVGVAPACSSVAPACPLPPIIPLYKTSVFQAELLRAIFPILEAPRHPRHPRGLMSVRSWSPWSERLQFLTALTVWKAEILAARSDASCSQRIICVVVRRTKVYGLSCGLVGGLGSWRRCTSRAWLMSGTHGPSGMRQHLHVGKASKQDHNFPFGKAVPFGKAIHFLPPSRM